MSLTLLCALAAVGYVVFDRYRLTQNEGASRTVSTAKNASSLASSVQLQPDLADSKSAASRVFKCFENGKMVYTNQQCSEGAQRREVKLHDSSGFIGTSKSKSEEPAPKMVSAGLAQERDPPKGQAYPVNTVRKECEALKKRIEVLDGMARQPQSRQWQDWMRTERNKVRARQHANQC